jgi:hypothetical protein
MLYTSILLTELEGADTYSEDESKEESGLDAAGLGRLFGGRGLGH